MRAKTFGYRSQRRTRCAALSLFWMTLIRFFKALKRVAEAEFDLEPSASIQFETSLGGPHARISESAYAPMRSLVDNITIKLLPGEYSAEDLPCTHLISICRSQSTDNPGSTTYAQRLDIVVKITDQRSRRDSGDGKRREGSRR